MSGRPHDQEETAELAKIAENRSFAGLLTSAATLVRQRGSRYSTGMKLALELPPAQAEKLRDEAKRLGLTPEDLARAALADLLGTPDDEFRAAAARILKKNQELYKRLA